LCTKQSLHSNYIRPLFLDDILIGLDNGNRIKLLKVLNEDFINPDPTKDFQIFTTTYARHSYEVAQAYIPKW
jgi:predicted restriction endonuclease